MNYVTKAILTIDEAAELLSISHDKVVELCKRGRITRAKTKGKFRVLTESVLHYQVRPGIQKVQRYLLRRQKQTKKVDENRRKGLMYGRGND